MMHLAVLVTNTDESEFAQRHPKDAEKFSRLISAVRPKWRVSSFSVKDGIFPEHLPDFDGIMITGSPASVLEPVPWVSRLIDEIRIAFNAGVPMFGACFGHQAIALALGGRVEPNAAGWAFGLIEMSVVDHVPWLEGKEMVLQYGAHIEHVTRLPRDARLLFTADNCPVAGFAVSNKVYTTQNHPEMTAEFVSALVEEYADKLDDDVIDSARSSLRRDADTHMFAESIARFFETARPG